MCLGHSKQQLKDSEAAEARSRRAAERRQRRSEFLETTITEKMLKIDEPGEIIEEIPFYEELVLGENLLQDGATDAGQAISEIEDGREASLDREQTTADAGTQTVNSDFNVKTQTHAATQTDEFEYLRKETVVQPFTEEYFVNNEDRVRFYTGLSGFDVLDITFRFVSPLVSRKSKTLTLFQEFVMVLIKLRLNVPLQDLAFRFGVSLSTISRKFTTWMTVLDVRLSPLIRWPERDELWRTMPMCFQFSFGKKTTIIIDCFEISIERPSNLLARAQTFSNYKHRNTVKVLIGITPQGSVCFTSKAWGGRTSDKYLTERCGFLNNLKPGDVVLADRGFTISESVAFYQAQSGTPAFTKGKNQLDPFDVERTRGIANMRIHVERVIGLLRQKYTILQSTLPLDYLTCSNNAANCPLIDRMIRVCSALTNLCPSVVPFE